MTILHRIPRGRLGITSQTGKKHLSLLDVIYAQQLSLIQSVVYSYHCRFSDVKSGIKNEISSFNPAFQRYIKTGVKSNQPQDKPQIKFDNN